MKKVIVIGCPGSGKSTFSGLLHQATGIPLFHLDMMYWNADKTVVEKDVFRERLSEVMRQNEWILDGNYGSTMEWRMQACDTVFFLDYPTNVCLEGIRARRGKARPDMPWTETEGEEDAEFVEFVRGYHVESRPKVLDLLRKYSEKEVIVLHSRREADEWLNVFRQYGDILYKPHHVSPTRAQMPLIDRAAQFSPFAALTGYEAAIRETARLTEDRIELDEGEKAALNERLRLMRDRLNECPKVSIAYFLPDGKKTGGSYVTATGSVRKIDEYERIVVMEDHTVIPIEQIYGITGQLFSGLKDSDLT